MPRRHADDAPGNAFLLQFLVSVDAELHLAAGADQDHLRFAVRIRQNICAARHPGSGGIALAIEGRQTLPGEPGCSVPAPSKPSFVLLDGAKSAEPPSSHGMRSAIAFKTLPEDSRVAIPLVSALNEGSASSQAFGNLPASSVSSSSDFFAFC